MRINNKKSNLSRINIYFFMLLFAMCLTMSVFFCRTYSSYELLDKITVIQTQAISESVFANGDGNHTINFKTSFLEKNNSYNGTITRNISSIFAIAVIPKGISLLLLLITVFFLQDLFYIIA